MIALLAALGIGGSLGTVIGFLNNPAAKIVLKFAKKALIDVSQGKHLSEDEKVFIRDYNHVEAMAYGHDFSEQVKTMRYMEFN
tara:strand:- start:3061 stop:3309 length:249 start_codon:yes stop_codon:yes gene_type:complete